MGEHEDGAWLHVEDVRGVVRLLSETAASRERPSIMKRRIASGLASMIDADAWIWGVSELDVAGSLRGGFATMLHDGLNESQLAALYKLSYDSKLPAPEIAKMIEYFRLGTHFTRLREDLVSAEAWRGSAHYKQYRAPNNLDEFICSIYPVREGTWSVVAFHRHTGRAAFSARDRRLVHVVMSELGALHADTGALESPDGVGVVGLSPRLRTVLGLLLEGWSRMQIAEHLGLSRHTIAEYMRSTYRHFGVRSQRELQARFHSGDGGDLPPTTSTQRGRAPG